MSDAGRGAVDALRNDLDERAAAAGAERVGTGAAMEYRVGGRAVVVADGGSISYRLGAQVARAAAATPDASLSPLGVEWVRFAPLEIDRFALDRAGAWFSLAVRLAAEVDES